MAETAKARLADAFLRRPRLPGGTAGLGGAGYAGPTSRWGAIRFALDDGLSKALGN